MRILQVVPTYLPAWRYGGPIWAVHGLARALAQRGHAVDVFTTNLDGAGLLDVPLQQPVDLDGVKVSYFPVSAPRRLHRSPAMGKSLAAKLRECEVLHVHSLFLWPTSAAARAAESAGVPYFVSPRGMLVRDLVARRGWLRKRLWIRLVERRTLARAAGLVVTSAVEAAAARAFGLLLPPLFEVPNGIDARPFAEASERNLPAVVAQAAARGPFLLYLGRLSWKKGLDTLVAALPLLAGVSLVLAGNDDEGLTRRLAALAHEAGVAKRVIFVGPVQLHEKAALLKSAVALVLPSLSENFGNVVLEAMAAGCPVAVTPEVGLSPAVVASGAGVVAPRAEFAAALRELLADGARLAAMRAAGPRVVAARFTWGGVAERMEEIYTGALR